MTRSNTLHRRGYQFVAKVLVSQTPAPPDLPIIGLCLLPPPLFHLQGNSRRPATLSFGIPSSPSKRSTSNHLPWPYFPRSPPARTPFLPSKRAWAGSSRRAPKTRPLDNPIICSTLCSGIEQWPKTPSQEGKNGYQGQYIRRAPWI